MSMAKLPTSTMTLSPGSKYPAYQQSQQSQRDHDEPNNLDILPDHSPKKKGGNRNTRANMAESQSLKPNIRN